MPHVPGRGGQPRGATLQPSCFIPATEGMVVDTTSDKVKKAQDGVLDFLLANHPLDCPVCDKGGECPLQDQTLAYGPGESRFVEEKRHFEKPIAISELVLLDRERCIQCARCTRFAAEVAGEAQIDFAGRGEPSRWPPSRPSPSPPTSAEHGADLPGGRVDRHTLPLHRPPLGPRPGRVHLHHVLGRVPGGRPVLVQPPDPLLGIDSDPVNHGWLCDKGRFAFESVNGDEVAAGPMPAELADARTLPRPPPRRPSAWASPGASSWARPVRPALRARSAGRAPRAQERRAGGR